jgi:hypothetical protein
MIKRALSLAALAVTLSSAAPAWNAPAHIKEIWIVPGITPVVRIMFDDGASNPYYAFYLNELTQETLGIAKDAINNDLPVKAYVDKALAPIFITGLSAPNVTQVSAVYPVYNLAIGR